MSYARFLLFSALNILHVICSKLKHIIKMRVVFGEREREKKIDIPFLLPLNIISHTSTWNK
jgi:hypothetical protein